MLKVKDIMSNQFTVLEASEKAALAVTMFLEDRILPGLIVVDKGKLLGIVERKDLFELLAAGKSLNVSIGKVVNKNFPVVFDYYQVSQNFLEFDLLPVVNDEGELVGCLTRQELFLGMLRSSIYSEIQMNALLNFTHNGIVITNREGKVIALNNEAARIIGVVREAAIGSLISDVIPNTGLLNVLQTGKAEYGQRIKIGNFTVIADRHPVFRNEDLVGSVAIFQDISERELLLGELREVKEYYKELDAILNSFYDGIYISDREGKGLRVNSAYERITGVKASELIGKHMKSVVEQGIVSESVTLKTIEQRKPVTIRQKIKTGVEVLVTGSPVFNEDGEMVRVVTNVRDLSELNRLHEQLDEARKLSARYYSELKQLRKNQLQADGLVAVSPAMDNVLELAQKLAEVDSTVLILGESGVGKEVIAKYIHQHSKRADGPFIKINCGAIPESLLESELFGYEAGAFTGAKAQGKPGIFELANQGTLFLDEIGELSLNLQVKLLRVLQDFEVTRLGGTKTTKIDVRLLTATNRDLMKMVLQKEFREDLYYRLNIIPVQISPLRDRREDIIPLSYHFLNKVNTKYKFSKKFTPELIRIFEEYYWPGNVREMENIIERIAVLSNSDNLTPDTLPDQMKNSKNSLVIPKKVGSLKKFIENMEKQLLSQALEEHKSMRRAAKALGIDQSTMVRKVQKYQLKYNL